MKIDTYFQNCLNFKLLENDKIIAKYILDLNTVKINAM